MKQYLDTHVVVDGNGEIQWCGDLKECSLWLRSLKRISRKLKKGVKRKNKIRVLNSIIREMTPTELEKFND